MTEAEWRGVHWVSLKTMIGFLGDQAGTRKLRLFACACCREQDIVREDVQSLTMLETMEKYADGLICRPDFTQRPSGVIEAIVRLIRSGNARSAALRIAAEFTFYDGRGILRDIFGNPFRPVTFAPAWRTDTAVSLARGMYESRDFSAMPILADALQDAGCDNDDVLNHCRGEGPHVTALHDSFSLVG